MRGRKGGREGNGEKGTWINSIDERQGKCKLGPK